MIHHAAETVAVSNKGEIIIIRFQPWVGNQYQAGGVLGVRTLVLGESHYGLVEADYPEFTRDVIERWGLRNRDRFLTAVAKTVLPNAVPGWLSDKDRRTLFESISFYNYIQRLVGQAPRQRPTPEMWAEAREPFRNVLALLRPQAIVVLGTELWWNLPPGDDDMPAPAYSNSVGSEPFRTYLLPDGGRALAGMVKHPSSWGYSSSIWQPMVQSLLASAAQA